MQKYLKNNNKGFTLVEVIVVAVIVLVLAAVAIPLYNGYVKSSRESVVENAAGSIATFLGVAAQVNNTVTMNNPGTATATLSVSAANAAFGTGADLQMPPHVSSSLTAAGLLTVTHCKDATATTTRNVPNATIETFTHACPQ